MMTAGRIEVTYVHQEDNLFSLCPQKNPPFIYTNISEKSDSENNTYITTEDNHSSSQITIYAFRRKKKKLLCPFCDGENSLDDKVCKICRRDL